MLRRLMYSKYKGGWYWRESDARKSQMFTTESDAHNALDNNQLQFRFGRQYGMGKGKIPVGLIPRKTRRTKPLVKEPVNMEIVMGGKTIIKEGNYNSLCIQWVRRFLEVRCIVRPNRWEYAGDLFAAYNDWAKTSSGHGYNLVLNRQRFGQSCGWCLRITSGSMTT